MSSFDYAGSKEMALRLVTKFGADCRIVTKTKSTKAKCVFMKNDKLDTPQGPVQQQTKTLYVAGTDNVISMNDKVELSRGDVYLVTSVQLYNFDNKTKLLYILEVAK